MAPPPDISPVTGQPVPSDYIHASSAFFQDTSGRSIILRGVNLSGSSKAPLDQPSRENIKMWEEAEEGNSSWVGRPLNLDDGSADVHLARLRAWGFNMLRYVFTWEAIEHAGPGKYDQEFMDYTIRVLYKCKEWGFRVFMDPHQDVWSRFSGGSGAPIWTLYACGVDPHHITPTYSALLHSEYPSRDQPRPATFPKMIWSTNYARLLSQTVWTLFFAGKTYAPKAIIDGVNIQDWLQDHYFDAVGALAQRIATKAPDLYDSCILGWDSMNEPGEGLIGCQDLSVIPSNQPLKKGPTPTPFEGMILGMGQAVQVPVWEFGSLGPSRNGSVVLDPKGVRLWLAPEDEEKRGGGKWGWTRSNEWKLGICIWAQHGVWDPTTSKLLRPDYFAKAPTDPSRPADFTADFWRLHWLSYASRIRLHHPEAIHFIQTAVFKQPPSLPPSFLSNRACSSPHYYDGLTLMTKHWNWFNADALGLMRGKYWSTAAAIKVGESAIRKSIQEQLGILKNDTKDCLGDFPTLIGEIGCPYDMDEKRAYGYVDGGKGEGDYSSQQKAWDCSLNAADGPNVLNWTVWTYCPDNSHEWGDLWNGEDLSLWSKDDCVTTSYLDLVDSNANDENSMNTPTTASSSSASSTTLSAPLLANVSKLITANGLPSLTPQSIESGKGITKDLIVDGSRALAAFCRPYPVATIGKPERMDFDIKTSNFKLLVRVNSEDRCTNITSSTDEAIVTEIYIPFAQYAGNIEDLSIAGKKMGDSEEGSFISRVGSKLSLLGSDQGSSRSSTPAPMQRGGAVPTMTKLKDGGNVTVIPVKGSVGTNKSEEPNLDSSNRSNSNGTNELELDLTVTVSHGDWSIRGQTLFWSYPLPETNQGDKIYTIEIKRRKGPIVWDYSSFYSPVQGGWGDVCPGSCVIA